MRRRLIVAAVLALPSVCLLAFTPLAYGATYYVAPSGLDGNAGTSAFPWKTIQRAANVTIPGDTIIVLPGVYVESVNIRRSGTAAQRITYQAMPGAIMESPDPSQSLAALDIWPGVSYVRVVGFELRGGFHEGVLVRQTSHHIEILDCHIHHNRHGVWWYGSSHGLLTGGRIHHNKSSGVAFRAGAHDILVRDTESYGHDDGLGCSGDADGFSADESAYNLTFERTSAFGNSEDGFDLKAHNVVIDRSMSYYNNCVGVKLWSTATLRNSLVHGNATGVKVTSIVSGGGTLVRLINNTLDGNVLGVALNGSQDHPYSVEVFNNIVSGDGKALDFVDCVDLSENFNIFYRPDALADHVVKRIACENAGDALRFSAGAINDGVWFALSGQGANSRAVDPRYIDSTAADFHPQLSSPAIDTGWSAVAPLTDLEGTARFQGNAFDIGAYEAKVVDGAQPGERRVRASIAAGADDAREYSTGVVRTGERVISLGRSNLVALRFSGVDVPRNAVIQWAAVELYGLAGLTSSVSLRYAAEDTGNSAPFATTIGSLSGRSRSLAFVEDIPDSWGAGIFNASPDLRAIVQEIVERTDWNVGNSLTLFIEDKGSYGTRRIGSFEGSPSPNCAARLVVLYQLP
jgi:hypothetical protein